LDGVGIGNGTIGLTIHGITPITHLGITTVHPTTGTLGDPTPITTLGMVVDIMEAVTMAVVIGEELLW
jgi:hypothetical protein